MRNIIEPAYDLCCVGIGCPKHLDGSCIVSERMEFVCKDVKPLYARS